MGIAEDVKAALDEFEKENPKLKGLAYLTSGDRTVEEQLVIILDPKRKDNYLNIKERFKKEIQPEGVTGARKAGCRPIEVVARRDQAAGREIPRIPPRGRLCPGCFREES